MILMGAMMFTGIMNNITDYLSTFDGVVPKAEVTQNESEGDTDSESEIESNVNSETEQADEKIISAIDFELLDQFGNTHKLSDYKGKGVFLNFWATWCPPCKKEMPDIQKLYEEYGSNEEGVIILGVASPKSDENQYSQEQDEMKEAMLGRTCSFSMALIVCRLTEHFVAQ